MADMKKFQLEVISPERVFYTGEVEMVELTTTEGDIGVYADHIPLTTIVAPGVLTITENSEDDVIREAAVLEGFLEILPDKVTILAQSCEWPEEIDMKRALSPALPARNSRRWKRRRAPSEGSRVWMRMSICNVLNWHSANLLYESIWQNRRNRNDLGRMRNR